MGIRLAAALAALLAAAFPSQGRGAGAPSGTSETGTESEPPEELAGGGGGVAPVELIPRLETRHLFARLPDGASASTTVTRMDIDFFGRLLLRYELPFRRLSNAAGDQVTGMGDIQVQAIGVVSADARHVAVLTAGVELDTATRPQLGRGKQVLLVGAAAAIKLRRWCLPYLLGEHQLSVAGQQARPDVNRLAVRAGSVLFGPGFAWAKLDLDATFDFLDGATARLFVAPEVGKLLIGRFGLFVRGGTQLLGRRELDYWVEAGARYLFRLERRPAP
jgi:hypothetical protein